MVLLQEGRPRLPLQQRHGLPKPMSEDTFAEVHSKHQSLSDSLTKAQVEVVLSHHDENAHWSDDYSHLRTIYCKGKHRVPGCISLANVGREGHTYLHHIVERYDDLAEWTVFSHAQAPTVGYAGGKLGGHMMPGYSFDGYLLKPGDASVFDVDDGSDFIFTGAVDVDKFDHYMRENYIHPVKESNASSAWRCPSESGDGWTSWPFGKFATRLAKKCNTSVSHLPAHFDKYWSELDMERPPIVFFAQGARFSASRERIHQRPKAFYKKMLNFVSKEIDPCENYFNEWMWYYMIGRPQQHPPCPWKRL